MTSALNPRDARCRRLTLDARPPARAWSDPRQVAATSFLQPQLPIEPPPPPALLVLSQPVVRQDPRLPDVRETAIALTQAVLEAISGRRPATQLVRWLDSSVLRLVAERAATARPRQPPLRLRSLRLQLPTPRAAEVAAHLAHGERSAAAALRLEARHNRWLCVSLQLEPK